ncbi:YjcQ family protein [Bacillus mojavensis]|nr:YjcQ family protein [Bacillus mojavensis]MEC1668277.1 YjcQ family protein [Bacillus mojavensis]
MTSDGENYLNENSTWGKIYNTAKEIRDWIK